MKFQAYLKQIDQVIAQGPFRADWQSLCYHETPRWYRKAKLGIFIHWGIYSVPGFGNEWYSRNMYDSNQPEFAHHVQTYGAHKDFGYKDFIPMFQAERFDADAWIRLFKRAGADYIMPVAEHHDGFAMYKTEFNRWSAPNMGPKRDVLGELRAAAQSQGLTFCASTHRAEHYFFMNMGRLFPCDIADAQYADFYGPAVYREEFGAEKMGQTTDNPAAIGPSDDWLTDWMIRTCELIDKYQPAVLYFDWWIHNYAFKPYLKKIAAYYYNRAVQWGTEVTINYKHEAFPADVATFDVERGALTGISPIPWQTCTAIGKNSWGYTMDNTFKSSRQIICDLIDIVSKNGRLLLNVGPMPDGTITDEETTVLHDLGKWLEVNGEGIRDTVPWKQFGEGIVNSSAGFFQDGEEKPFTARDFRFTTKGGYLYAFQMRPDGEEICISTLANDRSKHLGIRDVELLGCSQPLLWNRDSSGLRVQPPANTDSTLPLCLKIHLL